MNSCSHLAYGRYNVIVLLIMRTDSVSTNSIDISYMYSYCISLLSLQ